MKRTEQTYFIRAGDLDFIKIGKTIYPELRAKELQCGSPVPLRVLATVQGNREAEFHKQFARDRIPGTEWFRVTPSLNELIASLSQPPRDHVEPAAPPKMPKMPELDDLPPFLTPNTVARLTFRSEQTLANDRCAGRGIPFRRFGRKVVYARADVLKFIGELS